jgi:hypothetical protein
MATLSDFRKALNLRKGDVALVTASLAALPENAEPTVLIGGTMDAIIKAALEDCQDNKATLAERASTKASAFARSLALAIRTCAAGSKPDVRTAAGWKVLATCSTGTEVASVVGMALRSLTDAAAALDAERHTGIRHNMRGLDAMTGRGKLELGKGDRKAPCAIQSTYRELEDTHISTLAAMPAPARQCADIRATLDTKPAATSKRAAA